MSEERAAPPAETPPPTDDAAPPSPAPAAPPAAAPKPAETPWYKARIDELTAKLHRAQDELNQSRQAQSPPMPHPQSMSQAGPNQPPTQSAAPPISSPTVPFDQSAFDRAVQAEAQRRTIQDQFTVRCDGCVTRGREEFGATEFDGRVRALRTLVDDRDPDSSARYNGLLNAAFETGADAEIVHELGGDLDRAMRLLSMPPFKMAIELTRMADSLKSDVSPARQRDAQGRFVNESPSNAPAPIRPVGSRGAQHSPIAPDDPDRADGLSDRDWITRRNAQVAERQKNGVLIQ